eukprot:2505148-Rhodomonas_salina.3
MKYCDSVAECRAVSAYARATRRPVLTLCVRWYQEIGIGVVCESYSTDKLPGVWGMVSGVWGSACGTDGSRMGFVPGWEAGSIAFHTDDGHMYYENSNAGETFGPKCVVGDVIRCQAILGTDVKYAARRYCDSVWGSRELGGTEIACAGVAFYAVCGTDTAYGTIAHSATSSTDIPYAAR